MARKVGKINQLSTRFEDYSYFINGVAGVGKTTLAYEIGKYITGSNEGTMIITCGREPAPKHINGAFYDVAPTFKDFVSLVKELTTNRAEYPHTKFIAIDSADEFVRIAEAYVVKEWNDSIDPTDKDAKRKFAKSIKQAYGGFQAGEKRVKDLLVTYLGKLEDAGYKFIEIGHTKTKTTEDIFSGVSYEQITCNLDNQYYNTLKDKVNLVATCYLEKTIVDVKEKKNAFTKEMDKIGNLTEEKRVIVFRDDNMAIDTKSHFKYITPKVEFSTENFIKAVEEALAKQAAEDGLDMTKDTVRANIKEPIDNSLEAEDIDDVIEETSDDTIDKDKLMKEIRAAFKSADKDIKLKVKNYLTENADGKLSNSLTVEQLLEIKDIL